MAQQATQHGVIAIAGDSDILLAPDLGCVLAVGPGVALLPGDWVVLDPAKGKWMSGFVAGSYSAEGIVRAYGAAAVANPGEGALVVRTSWKDAALAVMSEDMETVSPTGTKVVIDRGDISNKTEGGILLTQANTTRPCIGNVVAIGPDVKDVRLGSTVGYVANAMRPLKHWVQANAKSKNYGLIDQAGCLFEVLA